MTYGYEVRERNDRMLEASTRMIRFGSARILPGALLVNEVPFLRHIPEWLPWLSYKPLARFGHKLGNEVLYPPIQFVKESIRNGTAQPSLALENLQEVENRNLSEPDRNKVEETIAGALGSIYSGQTLFQTISAVMTFLVAVSLYPDVLKRAQKELDSVVGRDRLPTFEDRPRLPFIDAIYKEVMRWRPVTPVDAVVLGNTWAILHDPAYYPEPDPARRSILPLAFGFGKRVCPGRHVADATLFILIASLASVFNIERKGGRGKLSDYPYKGALVATFPCSFIPRDQKARELILADTMAR
ncbi:cytochrome P450 [Russula brevipes]|nr:cytochrome P450 [Russula brevipes]